MILDLEKFGYRFQFDPFNQRNVNSTPIANNLALIFWSSITGLIYFKNIFIKVLLALIGLLASIATTYALSRSFFIIAILIIPICLFIYNYKKILNLIHYLIVVLILFFLLYYFILPESLVEKINKDLFKRFITLFDQNNIRYRLWKEGFKNIFIYPGGKFVPMSANQLWYHNLWLDTVRCAGVFPLIILLIINVKYFFISLRLLKKDLGKLLFVNGMVCLLIMFQDLVIENDIRIVVLYLYIYICMVLANKFFYERTDFKS